MARISGVTLPKEKRVEVALTYIYGIGPSTAKKILTKTNVSPDTRVHALSQEEEDRLRTVIEKEFKTEGDLRRDISMNIKRLKDIKAYRGTRHAKRLPARGQRTKTNSRTVRGNSRKTMGSGRKASGLKT